MVYFIYLHFLSVKNIAMSTISSMNSGANPGPVFRSKRGIHRETLNRMLLILFCLWVSVTGNSQSYGGNDSPLTEPSWNWAKKYAGSGGPWSQDIVSDGNGNYYVAGFFNGSLTFNGMTINSSGALDLFIIKANSTGDAIWIKQIPASYGHSIKPSRLAVLSNGNFLVGGYFTGSAGFPAQNLTSNGHTDAFLAMFSPDGNNLLAGSYSDAGDLITTGLACDAGGNSYMTANLQSTGQAKIIIFNASCQPLTSVNFNDTYFTDIACRNTSLYASGYITAATNFGSISLSSGYYPSSFTGQADLSGNFIWADNGKSASGDSRAFSVAVDNDGNTYSTGYFVDSIRFKPASEMLIAEGVFPLYVVKYNSSGSCIWASQIGEADAYDYSPQVWLDGSGNPFVSGYCWSGLTFGPNTFTGSFSFIASFSSAGVKQWANTLPYNPVRTRILASGEMVQCANNYYNTQILKFDAAANLLWSKQSLSDGGMTDVWYQMAIDGEGRPYIHGNIIGKADFNGNPVTNNGAYLAKLNGDGTVIWLKDFSLPLTQSMSPSGVHTDLNNNCFAWGTFSDSLTIESNLLTPSYPGSSMAYLVKYDKDGDLKWVRSFEAIGGMTGMGGMTGVGGIFTDNAGNVLLTGWFYDTLAVSGVKIASHGSASDIFVIKYSPDGDLVFAKDIGGTGSDVGRGISTDGQNYIYVTGGFHGTVDFGNTYLTSMGNYDIFLAKYDAAGNPLWARQAGSAGMERGHAVITDNAGNSYISGLMYSGSINFGPFSITSPWGANLFLAKYANDGTPLWAHAIRSPSYSWPSYQLGLDEEGSCYIGGDYYDTLSFDNGQDFSGEVSNSFFAKFNSAGSFQWNKNIVQSAWSGGYSDVMSVAVYNSNTSMIGGRMLNDTLTLGSNKLFSYNSGAFIAVLGNSLPVGIKEVSSPEANISVFPNPSSGLVNIRFTGQQGEEITYYLTDVNGKKVFTGKGSVDEHLTIRLPDLPSGIYFITVVEGTRLFHEKLILN